MRQVMALGLMVLAASLAEAAPAADVNEVSVTLSGLK
jgi:hypothetical protein